MEDRDVEGPKVGFEEEGVKSRLRPERQAIRCFQALDMLKFGQYESSSIPQTLLK